tara:strand:+ start:276 stop:1931 length:1656 start_codon:yes stop_codon:yes gene_type:complete
MAAIITDKLRKTSTQSFINDILFDSPGDHYIGIGKTDKYDGSENLATFQPPNPNNSVFEREDVDNNLIGMVKLTSNRVQRVIPRVNFQIGRAYKVYDPYDPTCFELTGSILPCYAVYNSKVYLCLGNNNLGVTSQQIPHTTVATGPNNLVGEAYSASELGTTADGPYGALTNGTDGYTWAFVCNEDTSVNSKFSDSKTFLKITEPSAAQKHFAQNGTGGLVYGFKIINAGDGTITNGVYDAKLIGNYIDESADGLQGPRALPDSTANGATNVQITVANGVVQPITWNIGNGQTLAAATGDDSPSESRIQKVSLVLPDSFDTKGVDIVPLVAPVNGFGYDPLDDLPSYYAGVSADLEDTVDGAIPLNVKYRQVSLIANPTIHEDSPGSDYPLHKEAINSLKSFGVVGSTPTTFDFLNNEYLIEQISNSASPSYTEARAFVDYIASADDTPNMYNIYYHQNSSKDVNKKMFRDADATGVDNVGGYLRIINNSTGSTVVGYDNIAYAVHRDSDIKSAGGSEYKHGTGEIIFVENIQPISRSAGQVDKLRLVLQF